MNLLFILVLSQYPEPEPEIYLPPSPFPPIPTIVSRPPFPPALTFSTTSMVFNSLSYSEIIHADCVRPVDIDYDANNISYIACQNTECVLTKRNSQKQSTTPPNKNVENSILFFINLVVEYLN